MKFQEDSFIEQLQKYFSPPDPIFAIGDDCAVIKGENGQAWLVTTDALTEGIHFLKEQIPPKDLGYKTVAVSVSDVAAMGGTPKYAFLSLALPKEIEKVWVDKLIEGIKEASAHWHLLLLGGDTVSSKRDLFLNLTLIGTAHFDQIKYRSNALNGDVLCVTGYLGNSGGGLKALQENVQKTKEVQELIYAHFHPEPQPEQGAWLAKHAEVHAMMDISDGLQCDLRRLLKSSKKGAVVEVSQVPISACLSRVSEEFKWDPLEIALIGGEDYCLLLTIASDAFDAIQREFQNTFQLPLHAIGRITNEALNIAYHRDGKEIQLNYSSFNHFQ